ncbi:MAG: membrane protease subunit [Candidatus Pacebacteria bacterium]|nr:membrane protease subunit [Candidatus Paceibacterota bacterium]
MILFHKKNGEGQSLKEIFPLLGLTLFLIALFMFVMPLYGVWQKELSGKAQLKEAEWSRQILIKEAEAKREAATLDAQAEVERAKGVAEANAIIADGLKGKEEYLRYRWIEGLRTNDMQVIYVPTEAGLPILEARDNR